MASANMKRYYVQGTIVPMEEDHTHEFKAHRNLTMADIPPWARTPGARSRAPVSRALNAFINTGDGGTVYMGIIDSGLIQGLHLTQFMKDHVMVSLEDVMNTYTPPVEKHRYKVRFIPTVEKTATRTEIEEILSFDSAKTVIQEERLRPHVFRTHNYCWCDKDTVARFNIGMMPASYVIEIQIKPWDSSDPRNREPVGVGRMKAHPIHMNEDGKAYFRRQASIMQCTPQEIVQMSKQMVAKHYQPRIKELKRQIQEAKDKAKAKST